MALKYWFKTANGSDNWNVAANWYLGSGGTGGVTTIPTAADDVIFNAASGSGTITISAIANCGSINMTGFTGTIAGASTLNITTTTSPPGDICCFLSGTWNHTGNVTFNGSNASILTVNPNGRVFGGGVTINSSSLNLVTPAGLSFTCVGTLTLTAGALNYLTTDRDISCGIFSSSNSNTRWFYCRNLYLTGNGGLISLATLTSADIQIINFRIDANQSLARSLSLPAPYPIHCNIFYGGVGTGVFSITTAVGTGHPNVFITNQGGQFNFIGTTRLASLEFLAGNNCVFNATGGFSLTIDDPSSTTTSIVGIYMHPSTPTTILTPTINFQGINSVLDTNGVIFNTTNNVSITSNIILTIPTAFNLVGGNLNITNGSAILQANLSASNITISPGSSLSINTNNLIINCAGTFQVSGTLDIQSAVTGTIINTGSVAFGSGSQGAFPNNSIMNVTGGNFTNNGSTTFVFSPTSIIRMTDTTPADLTFSGASKSYGSVIFDRGTSTGSMSVVGSNVFQVFEDRGTAAHAITFAVGTTQTITSFKVRGNPGNLITINTTTTSTHFLVSALINGIPAIQSTDYLNIQHSIASGNGAVWYAGNNSVNNQAVPNAGSGWVFNTPTAALLGLLGVG